jgi:hypothetical protein
VPPLLQRLRELLSSPGEGPLPDEDRSPYERFAIPYSFKPQLTIWQAIIAASGALLRIILGSVLFAVWGAYSLLAWSSISNVFLRSALLLLMLLLFAILMTALMIGVSSLVKIAWPRSNTQTKAKI